MTAGSSQDHEEICSGTGFFRDMDAGVNFFQQYDDPAGALGQTPNSDCTKHMVFEPLDFMARPAALALQPRVNLTR
jgi:hypothetical protein